MIENFLTKYLRWYNKKHLIFDDNSRVNPPEWEKEKNLLLYIHIPFCEELCPYCSFNRYPFELKKAKKYFKSLKQEIKLYKDKGFDFKSIYVGGGTPTILIDELAEVLSLCNDSFSIQEISCETNPNHLIKDKIQILKEVGVNRLSVGVQSFDNEILKQIERYHKYGSSEEIQDKLKETLGIFDTLNVDMIFNFPTQTAEHIEKDCEIIKNLKIDQVTFYPLMLSEFTMNVMRKKFGQFSFKNEKIFYYIILSELENEYTNGTCWCFSRKKSMIDEYIIDYDEYIGAGSGAFGYYNGIIYSNTFSLEEYSNFIDKGEFPLKATKKFSEIEQMRYDFLIKLFGTKLDKSFLKSKYGNKFYFKLFMELLFFKLVGAIKENNKFIYLTKKGLYLWVVMMREFFIGVNNFRDYCRGIKN